MQKLITANKGWLRWRALGFRCFLSVTMLLCPTPPQPSSLLRGWQTQAPRSTSVCSEKQVNPWGGLFSPGRPWGLPGLHKNLTIYRPTAQYLHKVMGLAPIFLSQLTVNGLYQKKKNYFDECGGCLWPWAPQALELWP